MLGFVQVANRELKRIAKKRSYIIILFILPIILFFLFAFLYNKQSIENLPIGLVDKDNTELSRKLTTMINSSHLVKIKQRYGDLAAVELAMKNKEIHGAVFIGNGFEANIKNFKNYDIHMYRSSASMVYGKIMYKALAQTIMTLNAGIVLERFKGSGMNKHAAMNLANPIRINAKAMYNASYNYQNYLVPGLTTVSIQMILIMIGVLLINAEKEEETFNDLLEKAKFSASNILLGKTTVYYLIGMFHFLLLFGVVFMMFNIPIEGEFIKYFTLFSLFVLACIAFSMAVSSIVTESLAASDIAVFYTAPSFVFSGFTFPGWAMPWYDQFYAQIMPYTAFLDAFILVNAMNSPWSVIAPHLLKLLTFIFVGYAIAFAVLKVQLVKIKSAIA